MKVFLSVVVIALLAVAASAVEPTPRSLEPSEYPVDLNIQVPDGLTPWMRVEFKLNTLLSRRSALEEKLTAAVAASQEKEKVLDEMYKKINNLFDLYSQTYQEYRSQPKDKRDSSALVKLANQLKEMQNKHFEQSKIHIKTYGDDYDELAGMEVAKMKLDKEIAKVEEEVSKLRPEPST